MARISSGLQEHLAVASRGHGVFKGVMKCRKIPGEKERNRNGLEMCQNKSRCGNLRGGMVADGREMKAIV